MIDILNESSFLSDNDGANKNFKKHKKLWFFTEKSQNFRFFVISGFIACSPQRFYCLIIKLSWKDNFKGKKKTGETWGTWWNRRNEDFALYWIHDGDFWPKNFVILEWFLGLLWANNSPFSRFWSFWKYRISKKLLFEVPKKITFLKFWPFKPPSDRGVDFLVKQRLPS